MLNVPTIEMGQVFRTATRRRRCYFYIVAAAVSGTCVSCANISCSKWLTTLGEQSSPSTVIRSPGSFRIRDPSDPDGFQNFAISFCVQKCSINRTGNPLVCIMFVDVRSDVLDHSRQLITSSQPRMSSTLKIYSNFILNILSYQADRRTHTNRVDRIIFSLE